MSFQLPGRLDLRVLADSQRQNLEMQQYAFKGLANLGDQIKKNIEIENARKEALQKQPAMLDAYRKGFDLMERGNIPDGMNMIYGANSIAQGNPLLEKIAHDADQAANILLRGKVENQLLKEKQNFQFSENQKDREAREVNTMTRAMTQTGRGTAPAKQAELTNEFYSKQDAFLTKIAEAKTPEEYKKNVKALANVYDSYQSAGANVELPEIPSFIAPESAKKLQQKQAQWESLSTRYANNPNEFLKKQLQTVQKELESLKKQEISPRSIIQSSRPAMMQSPGGGIAEGTTATNKQTGQKIIYQNGQWVALP